MSFDLRRCVAHRRGRRGAWPGTGGTAGAVHRAVSSGRWGQVTELLLQFLQLDLEIKRCPDDGEMHPLKTLVNDWHDSVWGENPSFLV